MTSLVNVTNDYIAGAHRFYTIGSGTSNDNLTNFSIQPKYETVRIQDSNVFITGSIYPTSCNVYDLGSSNYRWRDLYLSGNTIDLGGTRISRNNATGGMKITSKVNDDPLDFTAQHINALGTLFASNITIAGNNFVVGDNGSVGIGTNIPQSKMHIYPTNSYNLLQIDYNAQADVNVYPPSAISGNSVTITGQPYGNGSYTISSSTYYSPHNDYYVFDKNITSTLSKWLSQLNLYNSLGNYTGSVQTTHTTGTINGEWIQIFLPTTIQIISYSIANYSTESIYNRFPYKWNLLGSTNGTTWILLDSINNYTTWSGNLYYTFNVSPTQGYSYYRWVFEKTQENPSNGCVSITEIRLNSGNTTITPFVVATQYGNVGIGTALPTQKLDVRGNIYASGNIVCSNISVIGDFVRLNTITSNTEQMVVENAGTGPALKVTQTGANSVAEFYDSESGVALFVGNNGNIGIGTNAPLAKLDVNGNALIRGNIGISTNTPLAKLHVEGNAYISGNIGIGMINPDVKLHVIGTSNVTAIFSPISGSQGSVTTLQLWSTFQNTPADNGVRYTSRITSGFNGGAWGNEYLVFGVGNNSGANDARIDPSEKMRITGNGNVGIGTNNPQATLHVNGDVLGRGIYAEFRRLTGQTFNSGWTSASWSSQPFGNGITLVGGAGVNIKFSYTGVYFFTWSFRTGQNGGDVWNAGALRSGGVSYGYSYGSGNLTGGDPNGITYTFMAQITDVSLNYQLDMYRGGFSCTTDNPASPFPSLNATVFRVG